MTIAYSTTVRDNRLTQVLNAIDGGSGDGVLTIYNGTRPASGGTATTALATFTLPKPSATVSGGVLTFNAITAVNASTTGTATWARITDSAGTFVADMSVGTSGADVNLNSTAISSGAQVSITSDDYRRQSLSDPL